MKPNRPQNAAGMRIEPAPSDACASGRSRAATAAAEPPLDPPEVCSRFHGLRVGGWISGSVTGMIASSLVEVLPSTTQPPALMRRTDSPSIGATIQRIAREPARTNAPRTMSMSLIALGTPWNVGSGSRRARRASDCAAVRSARRGSVVTNDESSRSSCAIRPR